MAHIALAIIVPPVVMLIMPSLDGIAFSNAANYYEWQLALSLLLGFSFIAIEFRLAAILFSFVYFIAMYWFVFFVVLFFGGFFYHSQFWP